MRTQGGVGERADVHGDVPARHRDPAEAVRQGDIQGEPRMANRESVEEWGDMCPTEAKRRNHAQPTGNYAAPCLHPVGELGEFTNDGCPVVQEQRTLIGQG